MSYWTSNIKIPLPAGFDMETDTSSFGDLPERQETDLIIITHPHMPTHFFNRFDQQWYELSENTRFYQFLIWSDEISDHQPTKH